MLHWNPPDFEKNARYFSNRVVYTYTHILSLSHTHTHIIFYLPEHGFLSCLLLFPTWQHSWAVFWHVYPTMTLHFLKAKINYINCFLMNRYSYWQITKPTIITIIIIPWVNSPLKVRVFQSSSNLKFTVMTWRWKIILVVQGCCMVSKTIFHLPHVSEIKIILIRKYISTIKWKQTFIV